ncbi:MAG: glycosyltransferase [Myxococcota bacterium]|jgi:GT2 family glycosyltransferase/glycosyltransferase involved in cell wall biosynthesis|nr:glycosyltransferase [Myxococcota bacterium]
MKPCDASIVIPTRNAGPGFAPLLDVLAKSGAAEVLVVDSGSSDDTVRIARERDVRVHAIAPDEFGHGRTRNLGASLVDSPLVAFLSQDALPLEPTFLQALAAPFADAVVAGSYARVVPREDASPLVVRRVERDPCFDGQPRDQRIGDPRDFERMSHHEQRVACAFNNVASCVRRDLLVDFPFPDVVFGEDLAWSHQVMRAGWTIAFRPRACVVHSHPFRFAQTRERSLQDARLHRAQFSDRPGAGSVVSTGFAELGRDLQHVSRRAARGRWRELAKSLPLFAAETLGRLQGQYARPDAGTSRGPAAPGSPRVDRARVLFDESYYRSQQPPGLGDRLDPYTHYVEVGDRLGLWPHPLFDPDHFGAQVPQVETAGGHRFACFAQSRVSDLRSPHPLLDPAWLLCQHPHLADRDEDVLTWYVEEGEEKGACPHPLFDPAWYRAAHSDLASLPNMLHHYAHHGAAEGRRPCALFDPAWYVEQGADVEVSGLYAIEHYRGRGDAADLSPHPLFDPVYYGAQLPELARSGAERLLHYLHRRNDGEADPHPLFSTKSYQAQASPDVANGQVPIAHYVEGGEAAGYRPHHLFDRHFYFSQFRGAKPPKGNLLVHYLKEGARAGLEPNPFFDGRKALEHEPDANPLIHHLLYGHLSRGPIAEAACAPWMDHCARFFRERELGEGQRSSDLPARMLAEHALRTEATRASSAIRCEREDEPRVSIVIPAFGPPAYTLACLRSIAAATDATTFEVILVVDGPVERCRGFEGDPYEQLDGVRVLRNPRPLGFVHACNRGAANARGDLLLLLNNDTIVVDGWLDALVSSLDEFPGAGIVGSRLLMPNGRLQEAGSVVFDDGSAANCGHGVDAAIPRYAYARRVDYVSAASLLIERERYHELGGFDVAFAPAFYEDTDLAFRVRQAGREVWVQPTSTVIHFGGVSYARDPATGRSPSLDENRKRFSERWAEALAGRSKRKEGSDVALGAFETGASVLVADATMLTPDRDSGSLRMFNLLRVLRRLGCRVTFVSADRSHPEREVARLRAVGVQVPGPPHVPSVAAWLEDHGRSFDLCIVSRPRTWMKLASAIGSSCPNAKLVYDTVDLHALRRDREVALRGHSQVSAPEAAAERRACQEAVSTLVVSEADREQLMARVPNATCDVVSNIHQCTEPKQGFEGRAGMLFVGGFRHAPNVDAVLWFVERVLPKIRENLGDVVLHVVGSETPPEIRELAGVGVVVHGYVEDLAPLYEACRVTVAPLRYGAGVKGKVNHSMAHGLPCVATPIAVEGIPAAPGREILVAEDASSFAAEVVRLYGDAALWAAMSRHALAHIDAHFSFECAERQVRALFERLELSFPAGIPDRAV